MPVYRKASLKKGAPQKRRPARTAVKTKAPGSRPNPKLSGRMLANSRKRR